MLPLPLLSLSPRLRSFQNQVKLKSFQIFPVHRQPTNGNLLSSTSTGGKLLWIQNSDRTFLCKMTIKPLFWLLFLSLHSPTVHVYLLWRVAQGDLRRKWWFFCWFSQLFSVGRYETFCSLLTDITCLMKIITIHNEDFLKLLKALKRNNFFALSLLWMRNSNIIHNWNEKNFNCWSRKNPPRNNSKGEFCATKLH